MQKIPSSEDRIAALQLDVWNLTSTAVHRERDAIDILLVNEAHRFVVWIENKIDSLEHSNQLHRYRTKITQTYPGWHCIGVLLTPDGADPSDLEYVSIDYGVVCVEMETLLARSRSSLGSGVATTIEHYVQLLKRHIVNDSEFSQLTAAIYRKHRKALDLIFEHRPDLQSELAEALQACIGETKGVCLDHCSKNYLRFFVDEWRQARAFRSGTGWTKSNHIILFEVKNLPASVALHLIIGPGDSEVRWRLYDARGKSGGLLSTAEGRLTPQWKTIYKRPFLAKRDLEDGDLDTAVRRFRREWTRFVEKDLPRLAELVAVELRAADRFLESRSAEGANPENPV